MQSEHVYTLRTRHVQGKAEFLYVHTYSGASPRWLELDINTTSSVPAPLLKKELVRALPAHLRARIFRLGAAQRPAHGATRRDLREAISRRFDARVHDVLRGITRARRVGRSARAIPLHTCPSWRPPAYEGPIRVLYDARAQRAVAPAPWRPLYRFRMFEGALRCVFVGRSTYHATGVQAASA